MITKFVDKYFFRAILVITKFKNQVVYPKHNKTKLLHNCLYRPVGGELTLAHLFRVFDETRKLEKLYESKGIKPKLCSYRPVGGESTLAHLFGFFDQTRKLEKLYESEGNKPKLC